MFKYITERGVMKVSANSDIRVVELFAGVGGFRVNGLISATARTLAKIPTV